MNKPFWAIAPFPCVTIVSIVLATILLCACGGGSGNAGASTETEVSVGKIQTGHFAGVSGLAYTSGELQGVLDSDGTYRYVEGRPVDFSYGGTSLGRAAGQEHLTLYHLNPEGPDSDTALINLTRLLMSLDSDGDAATGIALPRDTLTESPALALPSMADTSVAGRDDTPTATTTQSLSASAQASADASIDFSLSSEAFANDGSVRRLLRSMATRTGTAEKPLVDAELAQRYLNSGAARPAASAPTSAVLNGVFGTVPVEGLQYESGQLRGITNAQGQFQYEKGNIVTFRLGNIVLGSAVAQPSMTEFNLARSLESNGALSNMLRFLMAINELGTVENGIRLGESAREQGLETINFVAPSRIFESNAAVRNAIRRITNSTKTDLSSITEDDAESLFFSRLGLRVAGTYQFLFMPLGNDLSTAFESQTTLSDPGTFTLNTDSIYHDALSDGTGNLYRGEMKMTSMNRSRFIRFQLSGLLDPVDNAFRGSWTHFPFSSTFPPTEGTFVARRVSPPNE